ncbi:MAG: DUF3179 domain-containing (seleno)protein [Spirochaetota bacterium]
MFRLFLGIFLLSTAVTITSWGASGQVEGSSTAQETAERIELSFYWDGDSFRDEETGSNWTISGRTTVGPLEGGRLESPVTINHFWFSWSAFQQ